METAYFSMEYAIDQSLKIYSGGLGFLAGSHIRSLYHLQKEAIAVGILWSNGYYEQKRNEDRTMKVCYQARRHHFLQDINLEYTIHVNGYEVWVKVYYLEPEIFGTAPLYLLTTDIPKNDHLSRTISHQLYAPNDSTRIAQSILLGIGGGKLLDLLKKKINIYHLNEAHALPLAFYLHATKAAINANEHKLIYTSHTPEKAGNSMYNLHDLTNMGYFYNLNISAIKSLAVTEYELLNTTATAIKLAYKSNGVSKIHAEISKKLWERYENSSSIIPITNGQNIDFWQNKTIKKALCDNDNITFKNTKIELKKELFKIVANQTGKLFDPEVLTIVWARRFAGYKRAWLLLKDLNRFKTWVSKQEFPVQIIWAGKPYPLDFEGINMFNYIHGTIEELPNCTILTGYELELSKHLKLGADVWLNTPRFGHEASGTSGMSAAMNGTMNVSIMDGWVPEYLINGVNGFALSTSKHRDTATIDEEDYQDLMFKLEEIISPMYYTNFNKWFDMLKSAEKTVSKEFSSDRMVEQYYNDMYLSK